MEMCILVTMPSGFHLELDPFRMPLVRTYLDVLVVVNIYSLLLKQKWFN